MRESTLFEDSIQTLDVFKQISNHIEWGDTTHLTDIECIELVEKQYDIMSTIIDLLKEEKITEAFILLRSVYESYFQISLILNGTKYTQEYKIERNSNEKPKQAYQRTEKEIKQLIESGQSDILGCRPNSKYKKIEITRTGFHSQDTDRIIPLWFFAFKDYDPQRHWVDGIESISSKTIYSKYANQWHLRHKSMYNDYLKPSKIADYCVLNDIMTEEQRERYQVHYNFLSGFSHLTSKGHDLTKRQWHNRDNIHYLLELAILYILKLTLCYNQALTRYFERVDLTITNKEPFLNQIKSTDKKYTYFWFIYDTPSEYDEWDYKMAQTFHMMQGNELDDIIPYYSNPFERLKGQHESIYGITTGQVYSPPWEKHTQV